MTMDELVQVTELQATHGSERVIVSVVIIGMLALLGVAIWYAKRRLAIELQHTEAQLREERENRQLEREERRIMFQRLAGDGNGIKGELQLIRERLEAGDARMESIEAAFMEHSKQPRRPDCQAELDGLRESVREIQMEVRRGA